MDTRSKLPFIYLPSLDLKILIDSGASNSVINPQPAFQKFSQYFYSNPFVVSGLKGKIYNDENIKFPILNELGISKPIHLHVIQWHDKYDALLGSADLLQLGANIDYKTNTLNIRNKKIPFYLEHTFKCIPSQKINHRDFFEIPVTIENGDVFVPEINLTENHSIPECIATATNGICILPNENNLEIDINYTERVEVSPLLNFEFKTPSTERNKINIAELLRVSHLNTEEKDKIVSLCKEFRDIFYTENSDLTFSNAVKHQIRTKDDTPIYVKSYRHPHSMKQEIDNQIQKLLKDNIIRPSISPYSAPVWIVPKKVDASGKKKFRMVIDYRRLNENTVDDKYPIPRIEEILDNLGKCMYFSTLDLAQGFHQIEMSPDSIEKTAFSVNNGHYEYVRMPFGLKNAPSTFQRVMDNILREYIHKFCFVYMDDIVIFSKSLHDHTVHIKQIFNKLREYNMKVQLDKSEFLRKEVAFLGHVITAEGIKPNPAKIEAVTKYPIPKTQKEIKSFLGLIGFYRKFIPDCAKIVSPITKCLKKGSKINIHDPEYIQAFNQCKELICNAPVLAYPDFEKKFTLTTDASGVSIASVLSQSGHPIAYYSRTLNSAERNYSTIERELLAIVDSTKHFRPYLFGQKFTVETDHNPLVWLSKISDENMRLARWKARLGFFEFNVVHKKGKENKVADALSRIQINNLESDTEDTSSIIANVGEEPDLTDEDIERILNAQIQDTADVTENPIDSQSNPETIHSTNDDGGKVIPISEQAVNIFPNRVIFNSGEQYQVNQTKPFQRNTYNVIIRPNNVKSDMLKFMKETFNPNYSYGVYFLDKHLKANFQNLCKEIFNNSFKIFLSNTYCNDIISPVAQRNIVAEYHESTHNGINETYLQLKQTYFWPNMKQTITEIINPCELCLQAKYDRQPYKIKFSGPLLAKRPFEVLHIDSFSFQNSKFLTIVDLFSRYGQAYWLKDGTSITALNKLRHYFTHHNVPSKIVCDEGREFQNNVFKEFCKMNKIELHFTTVNNPNSNAPVERFHSTILEKLRILKLKNPNEQPCNLMISAVLIYNQSIHSSTGFSPFHLLYGPYEKLPQFDLDMTVYEQYNEKRKREIMPFYDQIYNKNKQQAEKVLDKRNETRNDPPNLENNEVYVRRNKPSKVDPLYQKISVENQENVKIIGKTNKQRTTTAHINKVKKLKVPSFSQIPDPADDSDESRAGPSNTGPRT